MSKLQKLAEVTAAGAYIKLNPHKDFYEDAREYAIYHEEHYEQIDEVDWTKDIWTIQVYPRTPIGFIAALSNDIDALIDWAIEGAKEY